MEIEKFFPHVKIFQQACPLWAPLIENNEYNSEGADYFIRKNINELLSQSNDIDTILLACTHYPLLLEKIRKLVPDHIKIIPQGKIVAESLEDYLIRHPEIEVQCTKNQRRNFYTTDSPGDFDKHSSIFYGENLNSRHVGLN